MINMAGFGPGESAAINNLTFLDVNVDRPKKPSFFSSGGVKDKRRKRIGESSKIPDTYEVSRSAGYRTLFAPAPCLPLYSTRPLPVRLY